jgi:hypothetical protein
MDVHVESMLENDLNSDDWWMPCECAELGSYSNVDRDGV